MGILLYFGFFFPGLYSKYVAEWLKYFPLGEKLLVVDGENLSAKPWEELEKVQDFLGVPREITKDNFVLSDEKGFYCFKQNPKHKYVTCMDKDKGRRQEEVSEDLKRKLADFFRPYNLELSKMLGRRFSWDV